MTYNCLFCCSRILVQNWRNNNLKIDQSNKFHIDSYRPTPQKTTEVTTNWPGRTTHIHWTLSVTGEHKPPSVKKRLFQVTGFMEKCSTQEQCRPLLAWQGKNLTFRTPACRTKTHCTHTHTTLAGYVYPNPMCLLKWLQQVKPLTFAMLEAWTVGCNCGASSGGLKWAFSMSSWIWGIENWWVRAEYATQQEPKT